MTTKRELLNNVFLQLCTKLIGLSAGNDILFQRIVNIKFIESGEYLLQVFFEANFNMQKTAEILCGIFDIPQEHIPSVVAELGGVFDLLDD